MVQWNGRRWLGSLFGLEARLGKQFELCGVGTRGLQIPGATLEVSRLTLGCRLNDAMRASGDEKTFSAPTIGFRYQCWTRTLRYAHFSAGMNRARKLAFYASRVDPPPIRNAPFPSTGPVTTAAMARAIFAAPMLDGSIGLA
jgi:hypothetical protein